MIAIIDYGMGNLGSVSNMLKKIGANAIISSNPNKLMKAEKLILPGVGAFDRGMCNLKEKNLIDILNIKVINQKTPFLGICLGAQLITTKSEEGSLPGLGWIEANVIRFKFLTNDDHLKIPHMGWNEIYLKKKNPIFSGFFEKPRFYFVHSYYICCKKENNVLASSQYGIEFTAVINSNNIWGVQFHPEKSHKFGMKVLKNFVELC